MTIELSLWNSDRPALIDDDLSGLTRYRWRLNKKGYVIRYCEILVSGRVLRKMRLAHAVLEVPPDGMVIDHINRDKLDNRRCNLRLIPRDANAQNRSAHRNNITGLRGVMLRKDTGKFLAHARLNGRNIRLGYYETAEEAAEVARQYRLVHMPYTVEQ